LAAITLFFFGNVGLERISELCKEALPEMMNHRLHHFCFVLLKADPVFPPLKAGSRRLRVITLKVISELLVSLPLHRCLQVIDVLAQRVSGLLMFSNLLILNLYNI
jgi:hypothetical protein